MLTPGDETEVCLLVGDGIFKLVVEDGVPDFEKVGTLNQPDIPETEVSLSDVLKQTAYKVVPRISKQDFYDMGVPRLSKEDVAKIEREAKKVLKDGEGLVRDLFRFSF